MKAIRVAGEKLSNPKRRRARSIIVQSGERTFDGQRNEERWINLLANHFGGEITRSRNISNSGPLRGPHDKDFILRKTSQSPT